VPLLKTIMNILSMANNSPWPKCHCKMRRVHGEWDERLTVPIHICWMNSPWYEIRNINMCCYSHGCEACSLFSYQNLYWQIKLWHIPHKGYNCVIHTVLTCLPQGDPMSFRKENKINQYSYTGNLSQYKHKVYILIKKAKKNCPCA
jgi:hypothetical protein